MDMEVILILPEVLMKMGTKVKVKENLKLKMVRKTVMTICQITKIRGLRLCWSKRSRSRKSVSIRSRAPFLTLRLIWGRIMRRMTTV